MNATLFIIAILAITLNTATGYLTGGASGAFFNFAWLTVLVLANVLVARGDKKKPQ